METQTPISQSSLSRTVAARLKGIILSGQLRPGDRIDQAAIAESMGISKLPVREALLTLAADDLVQIIPRRGVYVRSLTQDDLLDHYVIFGRITGLAAERAALILSDADLETLASIEQKMGATTELDEAQRLNDKFHELINVAGSSRRLRRVISGFAEFVPQNFFEFDNGGASKDGSHAEHMEIIAALKARDAPRARAAMEKHFELRGAYACETFLKAGYWNETPDIPLATAVL